MKEFIDKLIERLEEKQKYQYEKAKEADKKINLEMISISEARRKSGQCFDVAIQVIEQLAEEYNNESVKGDLISRSALIKVMVREAGKCMEGGFLVLTNAEETGICDIIRNQPTVCNDGWIPCSERLPEEQKCKDGHIDPSEEVLVYIYYSENCVNNGCGVSRYWNSSKYHENPWIDLKYGKDNVIAWKPIAPYQPKGE